MTITCDSESHLSSIATLIKANKEVIPIIITIKNRIDDGRFKVIKHKSGNNLRFFFVNDNNEFIIVLSLKHKETSIKTKRDRCHRKQQNK